MVWQKINYIHANPVKAGLAAAARNYQWSSFRAFYSGTGEPLPVHQDGGGLMIQKNCQRQ